MRDRDERRDFQEKQRQLMRRRRLRPDEERHLPQGYFYGEPGYDGRFTGGSREEAIARYDEDVAAPRRLDSGGLRGRFRAEGPYEGFEGGSYGGELPDETARFGRFGQRGEFSGQPPKGYRRSDERILEDVCDDLTRENIDASDIEVAVSDGHVTLSGSVPRRSMRYWAEDICDRTAGVVDISNDLRVRSARGRSESRAESRLDERPEARPS